MTHTETSLTDIDSILANAGLAVTSLEVERSNGDLFATYHTRGAGAGFDSIIKQLLAREGVRRVSLV